MARPRTREWRRRKRQDTTKQLVFCWKLAGSYTAKKRDIYVCEYPPPSPSSCWRLETIAGSSRVVALFPFCTGVVSEIRVTACMLLLRTSIIITILIVSASLKTILHFKASFSDTMDCQCPPPPSPDSQKQNRGTKTNQTGDKKKQKKSYKNRIQSDICLWFNVEETVNSVREENPS